MKNAPKVFVSYSHDSPEHKQWVANLSLRLRQNGIDAILDQWDLFPGQDIPAFMEKNLSECDYALLVCTKRYVEKANAGEGGVGYEKMIVSSEMIKDMDIGKFVPLIRQAGTKEVPTFIKTKLFLDFSSDEEFEVLFDELLRTLFRTTIEKKPPLGVPPNVRKGQQSKLDLPDHAYKIFVQMIKDYDNGSNTWWNMQKLLDLKVAGKIGVENALLVLKSQGFVQKDDEGDWILSQKGKALAFENGIVKL